MSELQAKLLTYSDLTVGGVLGLYAPLNFYARNGDCFSSFLSVSLDIVSYHTIFDGLGLPKTVLEIISFVITLSVSLYGVYKTVAVCTTQYKNEQTIGWLSWF